MQSDFNARQMSLTAYNLYKGNEILAELMPIERQNDHQILFANGSQMLFVTANSAVLRSMPLNFAHLSEVRDYDDLGETLASIKVAPEGTLLLESTAGGEDDFYHIWNDAESAFRKVRYRGHDIDKGTGDLARITTTPAATVVAQAVDGAGRTAPGMSCITVVVDSDKRSVDRVIASIEKSAARVSSSILIICGIVLFIMMGGFFGTTMELQSGIKNSAQGAR
mgnify:CR=1 FL=1